MAKTTMVITGAATFFAATALAAALAGGALWPWAAALLAAAAASTCLAHSGHVTQQRQARVERGEPDLFLERNASRSEDAVRDGRVPRWSPARRWMARSLFGHRLMVGDTVRVESLDAIRATLDENGCLNGLPFMDEMAPLCGKTLRVYRVVDKIYDYGRSRLMRRLDDSVLLVDHRCNGAAHAGCEAACYLIWKSAWLKVLEPTAIEATATSAPPTTLPRGVGGRIDCQYTMLTQASRPMRQSGLYALLGPLVVGNVTLSAFMVAMQTRCFNALQSWRSGASYPAMPTPSDDKSIKGQNLRAGDWVRVKTPAELARAMNSNSKNRGLWFDRDMLKHSGQLRRVRGRIEKIIDIHSSTMIPMKTTCIVLDGVDYSGEFQGFGEQHDFLYWREAWLTRVDPAHATLRSDASAK